MERAGIVCVVCSSLRELAAAALSGAGAIMLTDHALTAPDIDELVQTLHQQPGWSDIPVIALIQGGIKSHRAAHVLSSLRNVTLLERPAPTRSIVSAVQAALRARARQYEIRDQIATIQSMAAEREQLLVREKAARQESDRAGRMKDEFLATLSHELRTPLNAILGWSQLLRRADGDREMVAEGVAVIERNTRIQVQLIEDLLDMSRIISGKIRLKLQRVDARTFIDSAIETVLPAASAKGVRLHKLLPRGEVFLTADPGRLQQVIWNLLSNSIKFTPPGGDVKVHLARQGGAVEIKVVDTGSGIDPRFLPHVFERFRQADASTTRTYGGLGLGLAIVKNLVELHGGTVHATSAGAGFGSAFSISMPIAPVPTERSGQEEVHPQPPSRCPETATPDALKGLKILVVDDEPDARRLIKRLLETCQAQVFTAESADAAMKIVADERPDILLSDIGMPVADGYELLRRVRSLTPEQGGGIPAIALTAFARSEDRIRALRAGFMLHVPKPVEPRELIATLATVAGRGA
jgi:signal transduction histidine kinase/ActR/RegA family two-component response regulator